MKKLLTIILILALILPAAALAEDNEFMGMSFIELMEKLGKVERALWASDEWKSVDVPAGVYKIGEDIPAGHWTITAAKADDYFFIGYGSKLNATETEIDGDSIDGWWGISSDYSDSSMHRLDIVLSEGYYLQLGHTANFVPYTGKPKPSFNFD